MWCRPQVTWVTGLSVGIGTRAGGILAIRVASPRSASLPPTASSERRLFKGTLTEPALPATTLGPTVINQFRALFYKIDNMALEIDNFCSSRVME